jgi:hypothetical protein
MKQLQHGEIKNKPSQQQKSHCKVVGLDCLKLPLQNTG